MHQRNLLPDPKPFKELLIVLDVNATQRRAKLEVNFKIQYKFDIDFLKAFEFKVSKLLFFCA